MKRSALLVVGLAAGLAVPVAFAKKPPPAGEGCKPNVSVILKGTLTSDPEFAGAGTFTMSTTGANKPGKAFVGGADETITVGADTKIRRQSSPKLVASLESGDRAVVHFKACKGDLPLDAAELTALTALRVNAQAPKTP